MPRYMYNQQDLLNKNDNRTISHIKFGIFHLDLFHLYHSIQQWLILHKKFEQNSLFSQKNWRTIANYTIYIIHLCSKCADIRIHFISHSRIVLFIRIRSTFSTLLPRSINIIFSIVTCILLLSYYTNTLKCSPL